jgi:hypothetical protein
MATEIFELLKDTFAVSQTLSNHLFQCMMNTVVLQLKEEFHNFEYMSQIHMLMR